jgi:hypothetical protein
MITGQIKAASKVRLCLLEFGDCRFAPDDESTPPPDRRLFRTSIFHYLIYIRYIYRLAQRAFVTPAPASRSMVVCRARPDLES